MIKIMGPKRRKREAYIKKRMQKKAFIKKTIKRSMILFCVVAVLIGLGIGFKIALDSIFFVRNITVTGNSHYDDSEIISTSGIKMGNNLLFVNSKKSESEIYDKFAYVEKAEINKKLPGSIEIKITTGSPYYFMEHENEYLIISKLDKLLEKTVEIPPELIQIKGVEFEILKNGSVKYKDPKAKESIFKIVDAFKSRELNFLNEIEASNLNDIKVMYDHRIKILIGSEEDLNYKLLTAKEIIMNKISASEKGTLNLKTLKKENRSYFTAD
ncbi:MAG: FtsQ-type POTRA domain-containing protein [Clostridia bacterium]|nr:FtsQ-type POTRA domain-containing protein [Clostridia bacterium]